MFKIAKQIKKERKDVSQRRYIKGEDDQLLTKEKDVCKRWKEYFEKLLNESNDFVVERVAPTEGPVEEITSDEVRSALASMKTGKAPGPSGISTELMKGAEDTVVAELTPIFQKVFETKTVPSCWQKSLTIPLYKQKGDSLNCGSYRGIRLLEHGLKLFEKIIERRLKRLITVDARQFGFTSGKSTTDAIFVVRQVQEKYTSMKKKFYHIFVDLEKAFDRVPRKAIEWALRRQNVP